MARIPVEEIRIDESGRLHLHPRLAEGSDYEFVYRAAMEVYWDPVSASLFSPVPRERSYLDWFRQIVAAVRSEYGDRLAVSGRTQWTNVPGDLRREITEERT